MCECVSVGVGVEVGDIWRRIKFCRVSTKEDPTPAQTLASAPASAPSPAPAALPVPTPLPVPWSLDLSKRVGLLVALAACTDSHTCA